MPSVDRANHGHSEGGDKDGVKVKGRVLEKTAAEGALYRSESL